jgi:DNA-binding response OmpR family regulator
MAHILIIDDEPDIRAMVTVVLRDAGHSVEEAANGAQGVECYRRVRADLVLCDLCMPTKEGLETIAELVRVDEHAQICAISGAPELLRKQGFKLAKKFGALRSLPKPFDGQSLRRTVDAMLARTNPWHFAAPT